MIDTGSSNQRAELEEALESSGCQPGNLKLILITHGNFDHTGNAVYLRNKYGTKIAMHPDDAKMAEHGDMLSNRKPPNLFMRTDSHLLPNLFGFGKSKRFTPDLYIKDGFGFAEYGFDAKVLSVPGYSQGSIGILTASGDLFCGDLFENMGQSALNSSMDDLAAAHASVEKLKSLTINTVYPGHGDPFAMGVFIKMNPSQTTA